MNNTKKEQKKNIEKQEINSENNDDEENSQLEEKECNLCKEIPDSIIYLSCEHIICLICAAKLIFANANGKEIDLTELSCGICEQTTSLSKDVQETIIDFLNSGEIGAESEEENQEQQNEEENQEEENENEVENKQVENSSVIKLKEANESIHSLIQKGNDKLSENQKSKTEEDKTQNAEMTENENIQELEQNEEDLLEEQNQDHDGDEEENEDEEEEDDDDINVKESKRKSLQQNKQYSKKEVQKNDQKSSFNKKARKNYNSKQNSKITNQSKTETNEAFLSFQCIKHQNEEYTYYHTKNKKLYCPECLLNCQYSLDKKDIKPMKKCFPEILQNFQDILNQVEVERNLLENQKQEFQIRKENCRTISNSQSKKLELHFDELINSIEELKQKTIVQFEKHSEEQIELIECNEGKFEERLSFFTSIIEEVSNIKQSSESPEEEIFSFFFSNQENINKNLDEKPLFSDLFGNLKQIETFPQKIQADQIEYFSNAMKSLQHILPQKTQIEPQSSFEFSKKQTLPITQRDKDQSILEKIFNSSQVKPYFAKTPSDNSVFQNNKKNGLSGFDFKTALNGLREKTERSKNNSPLSQAKNIQTTYSKYQITDTSKLTNLGSLFKTIDRSKSKLTRRQELEKQMKIIEMKHMRDDQRHPVSSFGDYNKTPLFSKYQSQNNPISKLTLDHRFQNLQRLNLNFRKQKQIKF